jgi:hypothetical protein
LQLHDLLPADRRRLPAYPLPAVRLSRLAVATEAQGKGYGRLLLGHAMNCCVSRWPLRYSTKNDLFRASLTTCLHSVESQPSASCDATVIVHGRPTATPLLASLRPDHGQQRSRLKLSGIRRWPVAACLHRLDLCRFIDPRHQSC